MKTTLPILFALASLATARPITITWDALPAGTGVNVYVRPNATQPWVKLGSAQTNEYLGEFPDTQFQVTIASTAPITGTGTNLGVIESAKAPELTVPVAPPTPGGLKMRVSFNIERSNDLGNWETLATISIPQEGAARQFFRAAAN